MKFKTILCAAALCATGAAMAADMTITMNKVDDKGVSSAVGTVTVTKSKYGLVFTPDLKGVTPGVHGFHVHENASCAPQLKDGKMVAAGAAGDHYDPLKSKKHGAAWSDGHRGDLPALYADANGSATQPVLSPRLKINELKGKSLMMHAGGDTHTDHPEAGGGGDRMVCGVIG